MPKETGFTPAAAKTELNRLSTVRKRYEASLQTATAGDKMSPEAKAALADAKRYKAELEAGLAQLRDQVNPFEKALHLRAQYETQTQILQNSGLLETLSSGQIGIRSIEVDGVVREYPLPTLEEVGQRLREKREMIEQKQAQGFTKLLLVPFGMPLDTLIAKYKARILDHHTRGQLFGTKAKPTDPDKPLGLNATEPVWVWEKYNQADENGTLIYQPQAFDSQNHQGKNKANLLRADSENKAGWHILLLEDLPNLPRAGQGKPVGNRAQIEANKTPREYLENFQTDPTYVHEHGLTPEDWLAYAITQLETTNQVAEDYQGKGSIAYLTGAYFPAADNVPIAYWNRGNRQARLNRGVPGNRDEYYGLRSAVGV